MLVCGRPLYLHWHTFQTILTVHLTAIDDAVMKSVQSTLVHLFPYLRLGA